MSSVEGRALPRTSSVPNSELNITSFGQLPINFSEPATRFQRTSRAMRVGSGFRHSNQKARLGVQSAACRPTPELVFRVSFLVLARAQVGKLFCELT